MSKDMQKAVFFWIFLYEHILTKQENG